MDNKYDGFYSSTRWRKVREQALRKYNYLCQECLRVGDVTRADVVHHIKELDENNVKDPNIAYNLNNLVPLCWNCHRRVHGHTQHARFVLDEHGNIMNTIDGAEKSYIDESKVNKK